MKQAFAPTTSVQPDDSVYVPVPARYIGAETVACLGPTLVVAPHADDESIACGGLIALLRDASIPVGVVVITDGRASHPSDNPAAPARQRVVREKEALKSLETLGVGLANVVFFRYPDGQIPHRDAPGFGAIVDRLRAVLDVAQPETIVFPFRADAHPDHRATFEIVRAAAGSRLVRQLEYPVMLGENSVDVLVEHDFTMWQLDVGPAFDRKLAAIAGRRALAAAFPTDDLDNGILDNELLQSFRGPSETYFEFEPEGLEGNGPTVRGESKEARGEHVVHESGTTISGEVG
jgi:LmbE family N-acetylglucosaminyl deacetylase